MNWYKWDSYAAFESWHTTVCRSLGIPHPGFNTSTGEVDPVAQWTLHYTNAYEVDPTDWRAVVDDAIAESHSNGLGVLSENPQSVIPLEML